MNGDDRTEDVQLLIEEERRRTLGTRPAATGIRLDRSGRPRRAARRPAPTHGSAANLSTVAIRNADSRR
jgi:hypothetical protein